MFLTRVLGRNIQPRLNHDTVSCVLINPLLIHLAYNHDNKGRIAANGCNMNDEQNSPNKTPQKGEIIIGLKMHVEDVERLRQAVAQGKLKDLGVIDISFPLCEETHP